MLIIGSGPAGLTAAIYAARANLEPIVIAGSAAGGQLMLTSDVENYPGFPEGIDGPDLMNRFREQAARFGTTLVDVDIDRVDFSSRPFRVWARGTEYRGESVIIATGAVGDVAGPRERAAAARTRRVRLRDLRRLLLPRPRDRRGRRRRLGAWRRRPTSPSSRARSTSCTGGTRSGRRRSWSTATLAHPKIEVHTNTEVAEVLGDAKVEGLRIRDTETGDEREMAMEGLFIAIGHKPNTDVFKDWLEVDAKGYLVAHDHTRSKIDGVFIAGDVHDHRYRQAVTAAGDGCKAAIDAERWLESEGIAEASTATAW